MASLLGKDATELAGALNLAEGHTEVDDDTAVKEISNYIKEVSMSKLREGKTQGEGMAKRTVLSEAETKIKSMFEVDGGNFDEILEKLSGKFKEKAPIDDSKYRSQIEAFKTKAQQLEEALKKKDEEIENITTKTTIRHKLSPIVSKFDFSTDRVRDAAIDDFLSSHKFSIADNDIFIDVDGKLMANFEKIAETKLSEWGKPRVVSKEQHPGHFQPGGKRLAEDFPTLYKELREAKTAEDKALIMEKIKTLEAAK